MPEVGASGFFCMITFFPYLSGTTAQECLVWLLHRSRDARKLRQQRATLCCEERKRHEIVRHFCSKDLKSHYRQSQTPAHPCRPLISWTCELVPLWFLKSNLWRMYSNIFFSKYIRCGIALGRGLDLPVPSQKVNRILPLSIKVNLAFLRADFFSFCYTNTQKHCLSSNLEVLKEIF